MALSRISQILLETFKTPTLESCQIESSQIVTAIWSQICSVREDKVFYRKYYDRASKEVENAHFEKSGKSISSFTYSHENVLRKASIFCIEKAEKSKSEFVLELWKNNKLESSISLSQRNQHGNVICDDFMSGICLQDNLLAYIAIPKKTPNEHFLSFSNEKNISRGQEYNYVESFGETLFDSSSPSSIPVIYDIEKDDFILPCIPEGIAIKGPLVWNQNSLIGLAIQTNPYPLGLIYCTNRPTHVFSLTLENNEYKYRILSEENDEKKNMIHCSNLRKNPFNDDISWWERQLSSELYPGSHEGVHSFVYYRNGKKTSIRLPPKCHLAGICRRIYLNSYYVLLTVSKDTILYPVVLNTETNESLLLTNYPHLSIRDVNHGVILGEYSTPLQPSCLKLSKSIQEPFEFVDVDVPESSILNEEFTWKVIRPSKLSPHPNEKYDKVMRTSIYVGPVSSDVKIPLIVWPHGGPHSSFTASFNELLFFFLKLGYGVVLVNYRGSLDSDQNSVNSLLGFVGSLDVKDVHEAHLDVLEEFPFLDTKRVFLYGGSHGGFLVTHLAGQYPSIYRGVVACNPVINIATMSTVTDIPDWTFNECGFPFEYNSPTPENLARMWSMSPISFVANVKCPIALFIGSRDLRVPPSQGREYYRALKSLGKNVQMEIYEDNHSLSKVPHRINRYINTVYFFEKCTEDTELRPSTCF